MFTKLKQLGTACICALGIMSITFSAISMPVHASTITAQGKFESGGAWSLDSDGVLTLTGAIKCDAESPTAESWPWHSFRDEIVSVDIDGYWEYDYDWENDLERADYSYMFAGCSALATVDMADASMPMLANVSYMFFGCKSLTTVTICDYDCSAESATDKCGGNCVWLPTTSTNMFAGCVSLPHFNATKVDGNMAKCTVLGGYLTCTCNDNTTDPTNPTEPTEDDYIVIKGHKSFVDKKGNKIDLEGGEFTFLLTYSEYCDGSGSHNGTDHFLAEATNDENGNITFMLKKSFFEKKSGLDGSEGVDFTLLIREIAGNDENIEYSSDSHKVTFVSYHQQLKYFKVDGIAVSE